MGEIWFEVSFLSGIIEKVEVEKSNDKNVWVKRGYNFIKRHPRKDHYTGFYPSLDKAVAHASIYLWERLEVALGNAKDAGERLARLTLITEDKLAPPPKHDTPLIITKDMI